jgi:hypothetical protein
MAITRSHPSDLTLRAGARALELIRDEGLRPERVDVLAGAAGGPKWLVLYGMDRFLFGRFWAGRTQPLWAIGSSIGAWRFAALGQSVPLEALDRFREAYIHQSYIGVPGPAEVSRESRRILACYLDREGGREILRHPWFRLSLLAVRARHLTASDHRAGMGLGLAAASLANLASRKALTLFFQRALFFDPRQPPPVFQDEDRAVQRVGLSPENLADALLASGSIPLVMDGVTDIPGARPGVYRDGGMLDYHLDLPYAVREDRLVLMPHFTPRIIPGWLDKHLSWRRPHAAHMRNVLLVAPSPDWVRRLPGGRIPDRTDFRRFLGHDTSRMRQWQAIAGAGVELGEQLGELIESGRIRAQVGLLA